MCMEGERSVLYQLIPYFTFQQPLPGIWCVSLELRYSLLKCVSESSMDNCNKHALSLPLVSSGNILFTPIKQSSHCVCAEQLHTYIDLPYRCQDFNSGDVILFVCSFQKETKALRGKNIRIHGILCLSLSYGLKNATRYMCPYTGEEKLFLKKQVIHFPR